MILQAHHAHLGESANLVGLTHSVPVAVNPGAEIGETGVAGIYGAVVVTAERRQVQLGEGSISDLRTSSGKQRRREAEQLASIVNDAIVIPVQAEERLVLACLRPSDPVRDSIRIDVEADG